MGGDASFQARAPAADCPFVRGRSFVDVLDDALPTRAVARSDAGSVRHFAAPPPLPFLFAPVPVPGMRARAAYVSTGAHPVPAEAVQEETRLLTPAQQRAVAGLNALGGRLPAGFNFSELRAAYRQLARRLHPDRHQHSGAGSQGHLARDFAVATGHYQILLALFPRH